MIFQDYRVKGKPVLDSWFYWEINLGLIRFAWVAPGYGMLMLGREKIIYFWTKKSWEKRVGNWKDQLDFKYVRFGYPYSK